MGKCLVCFPVDHVNGILDCPEAGSLGHFFLFQGLKIYRYVYVRITESGRAEFRGKGPKAGGSGSYSGSGTVHDVTVLRNPSVQARGRLNFRLAALKELHRCI